MSTHFTVDRGELIEPRHLTLVVSNDYPTERQRRRNAVTVAVWCALMSIFIGVVTWAAVL